MEVKEIIKLSAEFLNMKNIVDYLSGSLEASEDMDNDINNFLLAVNMVNNNIASSYIDLIGCKDIMCFTGKISYSDITDKNIVEIRNVYNLNGDSVSFKVMPDGLFVDSGEYKIEYSYFPDRVDINSKINHYLKLNEITFAMGVVGEYLFIKGAVDDAYMWDKRFKNSMFNLLRPKRNLIMPARRWE